MKYYFCKFIFYQKKIINTSCGFQNADLTPILIKLWEYLSDYIWQYDNDKTSQNCKNMVFRYSFNDTMLGAQYSWVYPRCIEEKVAPSAVENGGKSYK